MRAAIFGRTVASARRCSQAMIDAVRKHLRPRPRPTETVTISCAVASEYNVEREIGARCLRTPSASSSGGIPVGVSRFSAGTLAVAEVFGRAFMAAPNAKARRHSLGVTGKFYPTPVTV